MTNNEQELYKTQLQYHSPRWSVVVTILWIIHKMPLPRGKRLLMDLLKRWAGDARLIIRFDLGQHMYVSPSDALERTIYCKGVYESEVAAAFCRLIHPGSTVFDIGAHVGYYTLLAAARVGQLGCVHSFEPIRDIFNRLQNNVALNGYQNVHSNCLALSDKEGSLAIYPASGGHSTTSSVLMQPGKTDLVSIKVASTTIDAYVNRRGLQRVDLIKVDAEGAEFSLLRGGQETLARYGPDVILEMANALFQQIGYDENTLLDFMSTLGYQALRIDNPNGSFAYAYFSRQSKISLPPYHRMRSGVASSGCVENVSSPSAALSMQDCWLLSQWERIGKGVRKEVDHESNIHPR
jgi:FkbM family methyltransferase